MPKFKKKNINIKKIKYGKNVTIYNPSNIYECEIGDNSFIGPFVEIQKGVKIGKNTKIQSHTFICELVKIKNNVFVGHGVMFINDKFKNSKPALGEKKLWDKTEIGNNVSIGSNSTILPKSYDLVPNRVPAWGRGGCGSMKSFLRFSGSLFSSWGLAGPQTLPKEVPGPLLD